MSKIEDLTAICKIAWKLCQNRTNQHLLITWLKRKHKMILNLPCRRSRTAGFRPYRRTCKVLGEAEVWYCILLVSFFLLLATHLFCILSFFSKFNRTCSHGHICKPYLNLRLEPLLTHKQWWGQRSRWGYRSKKDFHGKQILETLYKIISSNLNLGSQG